MMNKKALFGVLAAMTLAAGCGDDSASGTSPLQPCSVEGEKTCGQTGNLLVCSNGYYRPSLCGDNSMCYNGACVETCSPETFVVKCDDNGALLKCGENGFLVSESCEDGNICHEGNCKDPSLQKCDNSYEQQCRDDSTWTNCLVGYVVSHKCKDGLVCDEGMCRELTKCDPNTFSASCNNTNSYTVCKNGIERKENCPTGSVCKGGECTTDCEGNESYCSADGMMSYVCENGKLKPMICSGTAKCVNGACEDLDECNPATFTRTCVDGKVQKCSYEGKVIYEECSMHMECFAGNCVSDPPCTEAETTPVCLNSSTLQYCGASGFKTTTNCKDGEICENGLCQVVEGPCTDGATQCTSASIVKECVDGKWHSKYCENTQVCSSSKCMDKGDVTKCSSATQTSCDGNTILICENGYLSKYECGDGKHCESGICYDDIVVGGSCNVADFVQQCLDDHSAAVCADGVIAAISCNEGICKAGACVDKSCTADSFVAECRGTFEVTACIDGVMDKTSCPENTHCAEGKCVADASEGDPCKPETFKTICNGDGSLVSCKTEDGTSKVHIEKCADNFPVCMDGACVACDPNNTKESCVDGHIYSCDAKGSIVDTLCPNDYVCLNDKCAQCDPNKTNNVCSNDTTQRICTASGTLVENKCPQGYSCVNGECTNSCSTNEDCQKTDAHYICDGGHCKFQAECALTDAPACDGSKIRSCKAPGLYDYTDCADGEICAMNAANQAECRGTECDPDTYGTQCSADGKKVTICEKGYIKEKEACAGADKCVKGACMGTECDPDTYGTQCKADGKTPTYCYNGYIKENKACAGVCINGACAECDHTKTTQVCKNEFINNICQDNNTYLPVHCDDNFVCAEGKGCISKCGEGFANSCNAAGQRVWCDNGTIRTETCDYRSDCVDGQCVSREGQSCIRTIFQEKCHDNGGSPVIEVCSNLGLIRFDSCYGSGLFCGTVEGQTQCFHECTQTDSTNNTTWCSNWSGTMSIGKCRLGKDYKGNSIYGVTRKPALCEDGNSVSCRQSSHGGHTVFDYLPCAQMGTSCTGTSGSCGFASCSAKAASCSGNVANNCQNDPSSNNGLGGLVQTSMNCSDVGATCMIADMDGNERALCYKSTTYNGSPISSIGSCVGNTLYTLYWNEESSEYSYRFHTINCRTACKTATLSYNGTTYSYGYCE